MKVKLKEIFLFKDLPDSTIRMIESFTTTSELSKGNILFYEGDESKYLHLLNKGIIKLYKTASNNKEIILKYFHDNELIGEVANFEQIPYPATAQAYSNVTVIKIDFEKLKEVILSNPELSFKIQLSLIKKIKNLENIVSTHLVLDSKERVAKYIYEHEADFFITKNILIAEILNITPETLSRILRSFKNEGLVSMETKTIDKVKLESYF
jgi:CRP/FNR family transcriptional regulator